MKNMTKLAVSAFISVCSMTSSTATPIHDRDEQIKPKPSMMGNYDITDQSQVWKTFKEDANSGIFSKLRRDNLEIIFSYSGNKKSLLLVSRGFNSLYMSGILPATFKICSIGYKAKNFTQEDLNQLRYRNVHRLDLSVLPEVDDVSALGNVQHLVLRNLPEVDNVSTLGNVQHLELTYLPKVEDVSALGSVQHLELTYLPKVEDVSALGSVQHLELWYLPEVDNVSALESVQHLVLRDLPIVEDVSALGSVQSLSIRYLSQVKDTSALGKNGQVFYLDDEKVIND